MYRRPRSAPKLQGLPRRPPVSSAAAPPRARPSAPGAQRRARPRPRPTQRRPFPRRAGPRALLDIILGRGRPTDLLGPRLRVQPAHRALSRTRAFSAFARLFRRSNHSHPTPSLPACGGAAVATSA
ncbi:unnamed protein product [Rangifer tarandus platyrhynchus]|uniref:Uncharacterized protein n=1 Tax=Rangifer tarandus platyrhynchus TaxID=3082113 RepID=A0ABN8XUM6_RANTA|nr:unnamed protein product [Rangifer tarandus platyrhynchus]